MKQTSAQEKLRSIHRRKLIVLGVAGAALVVLVMARWRSGPASAQAGQMDAPIGVHAVSDDPLAQESQNAQPRIAPLRWPAELAGDPFARRGGSDASPQKVAAIQPDSLRLKSILFAATPRAVINDRVLVEGDSIGGYRIQRIERRAVVVERDGSTARLVMALAGGAN